MKDDRPAFPLLIDDAEVYFGMTLRDYFAAKAMQGIIAARSWHPDYVFPDNFEFSANEKASFSTAQAAYKYADAMMEARK